MAGTVLGTKKVSCPGMHTLGVPTKTIFGFPTGCTFVWVGTTFGVPAFIFFNLRSSTTTTLGGVTLSLGTV